MTSPHLPTHPGSTDSVRSDISTPNMTQPIMMTDQQFESLQWVNTYTDLHFNSANGTWNDEVWQDLDQAFTDRLAALDKLEPPPTGFGGLQRSSSRSSRCSSCRRGTRLRTASRWSESNEALTPGIWTPSIATRRSQLPTYDEWKTRVILLDDAWALRHTPHRPGPKYSPDRHCHQHAYDGQRQKPYYVRSSSV